MRRGSLALCAAVALAWHAAPAAAQPAASDADLARAKDLYDEGSREYAAAHYDRAIELFLGAYGLSGHPAILFNVAQAYRLQGPGSCDQALSYYRRALAEEPDAANRAEIEERIGEMERCVAQQPAVRATPPAPVRSIAAPASSSGRAMPAPAPGVAGDRDDAGRPVGPIVTVAIGGAAALTGVLIYWQARAKYDEVEPTCPCEPGTFDGWETATHVSYGLMAAGSVVAAGGLVWWWRESSRGRRAPRLGLVPTAGGVQWTAAF